jgi:hypothetical protein
MHRPYSVYIPGNYFHVIHYNTTSPPDPLSRLLERGNNTNTNFPLSGTPERGRGEVIAYYEISCGYLLSACR